jgi:nitrate/nitrite transporter NarK
MSPFWNVATIENDELGVLETSFAAALPLVNRWYSPRFQGLVLGIGGAGNNGRALSTFFGPRQTIGDKPLRP